MRWLWLLMLYASDGHSKKSAESSPENNPDDIPDLVAEISAIRSAPAPTQLSGFQLYFRPLIRNSLTLLKTPILEEDFATDRRPLSELEEYPKIVCRVILRLASLGGTQMNGRHQLTASAGAI